MGARRLSIVLAGLVAVFAAVRLGGLFGDLWLDEIWSLRLVEQLNGLSEIVTRLHVDGNHPLNSAWLYLLLPAKAEWTYRVLAWTTGSAAVGLAGLVGHRQYALLHPREPVLRARVAGWLAALLVGGSYLLIHYSSEARGYAPAAAFSLLAVYALLQAGARRERVWLGTYWGACALGLLSHIVAAHVLLAGAVWSGVRCLQERSGWRACARQVARWHLVPLTLLGIYYLVFVRQLTVGGGPELDLVTVLGDVGAFTLGLPAATGTGLALPLLAGMVSYGVWLLVRRGNWALAAFYATVVFVSPATGGLLGGFDLLFPRYFIISAVASLLLASYVLSRLWTRGGAWRGGTLLVIALFLVGNGIHVARLVRDGRGQYRAAMRHIAQVTPSPVITVTSDHDFRNTMVLNHHASALGPGRRLRYVNRHEVTAGGVDWVLLHRLDGEKPPADVSSDRYENRYRLDAVFRHAALSGWDWFVYRRQGPGNGD